MCLFLPFVSWPFSRVAYKNLHVCFVTVKFHHNVYLCGLTCIYSGLYSLCFWLIIHVLTSVLENSQPLYLYVLLLHYSPFLFLELLLDLCWTFSFYHQYFKISLSYFSFEISCLVTVANSMLFTFNFSAIVIWEWQVKSWCFTECYRLVVNFLKGILCILWGKAWLKHCIAWKSLTCSYETIVVLSQTLLQMTVPQWNEI